MKKKLTYLILFLVSGYIIAGENNLYNFNWLDPDKAVYVLQKKIYPKQNTFYANVGYGTNISAEFQNVSSIQVNGGYYLWEQWGLELLYSKVMNKDSDSLKNLSNKTRAVPFIRRFDSYYGGSVIFSPFYAKINTFNTIFYFDWNFGLGLLKIDSEKNEHAFITENSSLGYEKESLTGYLAKTQVRFYIMQSLTLNIDVLKIFYKATSPANPNGGMESTTDILFSIGSFI